MSTPGDLTQFPGAGPALAATDKAELAEAALASWGGAMAPPRLVVDRENAVFDVTTRDGVRGALRLHRVGSGFSLCA